MHDKKSIPVNLLLDKVALQKISENRSVLHSIVDTIILCGHLGISFRGHRYDSKYYPEAGKYSQHSVGNFIELLNFAIRRGDNVLKDHYEKHRKNASYLSKQTQNELIDICGALVQDEIVSKVKQSRFYSILADEAMDISGKEQLSFVLRYVESSGNIREDFLGFIHLKEGLTGKDLSTAILEKIHSFRTLYRRLSRTRVRWCRISCRREEWMCS